MDRRTCCFSTAFRNSSGGAIAPLSTSVGQSARPAGSSRNQSASFLSFQYRILDVAAITGFDVSSSKKPETLRKSVLVKPSRLLIFADALSLPEADVEDIFDPEVYVRIVNQAFQLPVAES